MKRRARTPREFRVGDRVQSAFADVGGATVKEIVRGATGIAYYHVRWDDTEMERSVRSPFPYRREQLTQAFA